MKLLWQIYASLLFVTLLSLVAVTFYGTYAIRPFYEDQLRGDLTTIADVAAEHVAHLLDAGHQDQIDAAMKKLGQAGDTSTRLTVILPSGRVLGDSDEDPAIMENHAGRPEIQQAIEEGVGWSMRYSHTLAKNMMYVAVSVKSDDEVAAVVRTSIAATAIDRALADIYKRILIAGLVIAVGSAVLSLIISRQITRPVVAMQDTAREFARGRLDMRVPVTGTVEFAQLAATLNDMADQLNERIQTVTRQRNELDAVLSSMVEGVLAVDSTAHIVSINKAAAELMQIDRSHVNGRNLEEVIRNADLKDFVNETLASQTPTEAEIRLSTRGGRYFQLHGAVIRDLADQVTGAVIVLSDMTRIRRLEKVRQDFVANVSHELRTPVTSIQGFVEALVDGAKDDPQQRDRYLSIIAKHADRLNAIIEDLLSLSRLEEGRQRTDIDYDVTPLRKILESAVELAAPKAAENNTQVELVCDETLNVNVNAPLIEQAVLNLVDNAVKYSEPDSKVVVTGKKIGDEIAVSVKDSGCGIPVDYQSRIFERFYVVDKSRSRRMGGTGLGLAIVKHIALAHAGRVTVESSPGAGSTFTIALPAS